MKPVIAPPPIAGDNYAVANYLTLEKRAVGQRHGSGSELSSEIPGLDGVACVIAAGVTNGQIALVDANHDWRDRVIHGFAADINAAANRPGGASDYTNWPAPMMFCGYTRTGAISNVTTGAAVSNGNPPVWGTGAGGTSTAVTVTANVLLYCDPTTGALYVYNALGAPIHYWFQATATADLGRH